MRRTSYSRFRTQKADEALRRIVSFEHNLKKCFPKNAGISEQCRKMVRNAARNSMTFAAFCAAIPHWMGARPEGPRATAPLSK
jgi:hypothetical protein